MRLSFILAERVPPVPSPILVEVTRLLRARGHDVDGFIPEHTLLRSDRLVVARDLYLLKSHTELALSLAAAFDAGGARVLNPVTSCAHAQDKVVSMMRLAMAGIPVPRTWVTADLSLLADEVAGCPLIVKPHRGHRGAGIVVARDIDELVACPTPIEPVVIQEFVDGPGHDLKVYVVGDHVSAVRKPFSATSFTVAGEPCVVTDEVRKIALRAGEAAGLGLYGLDLIEADTGPVVVDLNYFPGYKGVPDAAPAIADYIHAFATGPVELLVPTAVHHDVVHAGIARR